MMSAPEVRPFNPKALVERPWWQQLHAIILQASKLTRQAWPLPGGFQRLGPDAARAGRELCEEVDSQSTIAVALLAEAPVWVRGCAEVQRSSDKAMWMVPSVDEGASKTEATPNAVERRWEINLVTTAPAYRENGIARELVSTLEQYVLRNYGPSQLMVYTVDEISGAYWRKVGFYTAEEFCIVLPKGFSHVRDAPDEFRIQKDVKLLAGQKRIH
ncbi:uncharacterized protein PV09_06443 [Verruconis gallopava]|uniref:N-acetyltransferase domain-containing protein n=1 Tax=Verruconis gallopava TaxID=253628 RepID=A0A0D1XJ11_9PEZI|nr:uncharacterized protein PV09_06443 [Verruconis gallopava]KIW02296.1 hypothetical protein PV09_06443 [Verruconis gallopava]